MTWYKYKAVYSDGSTAVIETSSRYSEARRYAEHMGRMRGATLKEFGMC